MLVGFRDSVSGLILLAVFGLNSLLFAGISWQAALVPLSTSADLLSSVMAAIFRRTDSREQNSYMRRTTGCYTFIHLVVSDVCCYCAMHAAGSKTTCFAQPREICHFAPKILNRKRVAQQHGPCNHRASLTRAPFLRSKVGSGRRMLGVALAARLGRGRAHDERCQGLLYPKGPCTQIVYTLALM